MAQSIILSTVTCALVVLYLITTTTAQWKSCFDNSCPVLNILFSSRTSSISDEGKLEVLIVAPMFKDNQITCKLYAPASNVPGQTISIESNEDTRSVLFTCSVPVTKTYGPNYTITYTDYGIHPDINGTAIYLKGKLYCSWSVEISNSTFPYELIDPPQYYISKSGYQIYYKLNQTVPVAAANYSQLPASVESFVDGYNYKALGSEKYLLIARVTNQSTDFLLKVNGKTPELVDVKLKSETDHQEITIEIECDFKKRILTSRVKFFEMTSDLWNLVDFTEIDDNECRWSLPDLYESIYGSIKPKQTVYQLQIVENHRFVYFDEDNFRIITPTSASSSLGIAKSLLIVILFSVILS